MRHLKYVLFATVVGSSTVASANAFNINEHDARVTGRGGATAASNTTPSSMVFNPGGLAVAEGTNILLGGSLYIAQGWYEPMGGGDRTKTDSPPAVVPNLYVTSRLSDLVAIGAGLHFPFGSTISWPTAHAQSEGLQDQTLRSFFITPTIGFNLEKWVPGLSIGGGVDLVPATVELEQAVVFGDTRGSAHLGGDAFGIGGRAGVMYRPRSVPQLKVGVMWRSDIKLDFEGKGDFDIEDPFRSQLPPDGDISTSITLPQSVWGGVAFDATPELELEANVVWMNWEKFKELRVNLPGDAVTVSPQNYRDTVTLRFGAEYQLVNAKTSLRAGFIYDPTPIPSTTITARLPDANRMTVTVGASKYFGRYSAHAGLLWVTPAQQDTSDEMYTPVYKGTYGIQAVVASLGLGATI